MEDMKKHREEELRELANKGRGWAGWAQDCTSNLCKSENKGANMKRICVLGLGYIGVPTACLFANANHEVIGIDINQEVVERLDKGELPFEEKGKGLTLTW